MSRILLVDDDEDYASVVRMRLEKEGYQIEWAANPVEAVNRLEKDFGFDLIILDVEMPERNGMSTLAHIRSKLEAKKPGGFDIPVIVATGLQSTRLRAIFESQNVADYIQKPFESHALIEKIEKILAKKSSA